MIFSLQSLFSDDQAITATALCTDVVDTGVRGTPKHGKAALHGDVGKAYVPIVVQVTEDFATLTSLTITVETSANSNMSSSTVLASQTIPVAGLKVGAQFAINSLPKGVVKRYLALRYTVTGSNATTGKITAGVGEAQTNVTGA